MVRFPAYPYRVQTIGWQDGRLSARVGVESARKRPQAASGVGCPATGLTLETGQQSRHYIA